jgi:hypothetical protein
MQSVIYIRRMGFLHAECNFHVMFIIHVMLKHRNVITTLTTVISTTVRVILKHMSVIMTRTSVIYTRTIRISTRYVILKRTRVLRS